MIEIEEIQNKYNSENLEAFKEGIRLAVSELYPILEKEYKIGTQLKDIKTEIAQKLVKLMLYISD